MTLLNDQIQPGRATTDDATGRLGEHNGVLGVALAQWIARDDSKAEPDVRRAANTAIDAMLRELHTLRARQGSGHADLADVQPARDPGARLDSPA